MKEIAGRALFIANFLLCAGVILAKIQPGLSLVFLSGGLLLLLLSLISWWNTRQQNSSPEADF